MANQPVRVAVVGVGLWGGRAHLPALKAIPDVDVVSLVDERVDLATALGSEFGVPKSYTEIRALFADDTSLDAVVIATPTDTHADVVGVALAAGVHILCEKPLAYNLSQARDLAR